MIKAEFVAGDGTRFDGYVSPQHEARISGIQPTVVTSSGQVGFWLGSVFPETWPAR